MFHAAASKPGVFSVESMGPGTAYEPPCVCSGGERLGGRGEEMHRMDPGNLHSLRGLYKGVYLSDPTETKFREGGVHVCPFMLSSTPWSSVRTGTCWAFSQYRFKTS